MLILACKMFSNMNQNCVSLIYLEYAKNKKNDNLSLKVCPKSVVLVMRSGPGLCTIWEPQRGLILLK